MTTSTITREVPRPTEPVIVLPPGVRPARGDAMADALFCTAVGLADGIEEHRAAGREQVRRNVPWSLKRSADEALAKATAEVARVYESGDADKIMAAMLARHEAARVVEALAYRPPAAGRAPGPATAALKAGIAARAELTGHWCALASDMNWLTAEQWDAGAALAATRVRPSIERLEQARAVLEDAVAPERRRIAAKKHVADTELVMRQVRSLAGLDPTEGVQL